MTEPNMDWIKSQLQEAKVRKVVGDSVIKLIEVFATSDKMTDEHKEKTVELFSKLALGHAYIAENNKERWMPVQPGNIKVADIIRVKSDAFVGELGEFHNGRRGVVVAVRYGDVVMKSNDGKEPVLEGAHYAPQKLEKLVN